VCRGTLDRMNALPGQGYPAAAGGGTVDSPRGVLLIGDLTENGASADWMALTNDWGLTGERRLAFPVYEAFGNHDCNTGEVVPAGIKARNPFRLGVTNISANGYHYSWDWDYLHVVCLNLFPGQTPDTYGQSPRDSLAFLVDDLAKTVGNSGRPVILYHHYGFDSFGLGWWSDSQRSAYFEAIKNYNVIAIFAGHNHEVDCVPWRGLNTFNDGTVGKTLDSTDVISFLVAHVTPTNLTVVERRADDTWGVAFHLEIAVSYQPRIVSSPLSTTAPVGSGATLAVQAVGPNLNYQWFFNGTNAIAGATNSALSLPNLRLSESGAYLVLVTNSYGAEVSQPAALAVSVPLVLSPVPGLTLSGDVGASLNLEYSDSLVPSASWHPMATVVLTNTTGVYIDNATPSRGQRFYRVASPTARVGITQVPAITVFGDAGDSLRIEYSDAPDPGARWLPLAAITLTNTSQLYVDASAPGLTRYYRAVPSP